MIRSGRLISALPTASNCCSPPESVPPFCQLRSLRRGKSVYTHSISSAISVRSLREYAPSYTKAPPNCEYDWGMSFAVDATGKGYLACVSDSMVDPGNPVLPYGQAVSLGGISCVSAKTGMTCTNAAGHGFSVAKARQKLF